MNSKIIKHFRLVDPILAILIEESGDKVCLPKAKPVNHVLSELCETIVSQQLSVKAAATIWSRAKLIISDWDDPYAIIGIDDTALRTVGLSGQKASYVKNIAQAIIDGMLDPTHYHQLQEAIIIDELVRIKGIGIWTAEMFLIFTLGREDVFSIGDLGLRNAIKKLYGELSLIEMQKLSEKWQPYRSYASLLLWRSLDNQPKKS